MTAADTHSITSADVQEHNRHIIRPQNSLGPLFENMPLQELLHYGLDGMN